MFATQSDYVISRSYLPDPLYTRQREATLMAWFVVLGASVPNVTSAGPTVVGLVPWNITTPVGDTSFMSIVLVVRLPCAGGDVGLDN